MLIQRRLTESNSLLDVGCNAGHLTVLAAGFGVLALGVDANSDVLAEACHSCRPYLSLAFLHFVVTPENVAQLPYCDVVLCLSVYHQWHAKFGHGSAQRILRTLDERAHQRLFFEPPSKQSKYGAEPPPIIDRDESSIVSYNERMLGQLFSSGTVEYLGGTQASRSESSRYLFCVEMNRERTGPETTGSEKISPAA